MVNRIKRGQRFTLYLNGCVYEGSKYITTIMDANLVDYLLEGRFSKRQFDDLVVSGEDMIQKFYDNR